MTIGIVIIGRNEGERFQTCIRSVQGRSDRIVYVDSGSTDDSVQWAEDAGFQVEILPSDRPFTAARARNAGYRRLLRDYPSTDFIQFIDGDCQLDAGWLKAAQEFLETNPDVAVVFGRRRERFPEASIYNTMCDIEWNTPIGERQECGGDCLVRGSAFNDVGGYHDDLIAGEEPEMCLRLREKGWRIWRLDAEMTLHDANMHRITQWWKRSVRAGHAFAEVSWRHRNSPKKIWQTNVVRAVFWGGVLPVIAGLGGFLFPETWLLLLAYPAQIARLAIRSSKNGQPALIGFYDVLGKFAEARGVLMFHLNRHLARRATLIEYK
ncbi:glycosyltransferase family 2 protein [Labrenzia sp. PHM005]|uniref:glycosyltransferase n=1 Tax=Labrenzia sp. PHM005 TaxID=2590016 RepID=UPI0011402CB8|nr:glycosyltransferase family A protein [Labrenzia sp. PHM005]QDG74820.1 glycosyltransferase family 2 protein [Labrenzia sp. PHM005]